jgi:hypothetical protein
LQEGAAIVRVTRALEHIDDLKLIHALQLFLDQPVDVFDGSRG